MKPPKKSFGVDCSLCISLTYQLVFWAFLTDWFRQLGENVEAYCAGFMTKHHCTTDYWNVCIWKDDYCKNEREIKLM